MREGKLKVLVADDNRLQLALTRDALSEAGFEVYTVEQGKEVYKKVLEHKPDIILLDIMMPEVDGIEICRVLKAHPQTRNSLILIYSAKRDLDLMDLAYEAGAEGFILKSDDFNQIISQIKEIYHEKREAQA